MSRHPYTYAADYIRGLGPVSHTGLALSRADASQIRQGIAKAIGMDDQALAEKLSIYFMANQEEICSRNVDRYLQRPK